jgi:8-oxo-dGTP pyrophosphatase MutT (NUDIX family)
MSPSSAAAEPRPAATVLLLREIAGELEVLMMRRGAGLAFMAGMWVFPGGRLEGTDCSTAMLAHLPAETRAQQVRCLCDARGEPLPADVALGLHVAACRETFEESGVLLAAGEPVAELSPDRLGFHRAEVARDPSRFVGLLEELGLALDVDRFVYWSHWITPSVEPKRYDTRFFAVELTGTATVEADQSELTEHSWVRPESALAALGRGEMQMVPPTILTLEDLAESHRKHGSLPGMLAAERHRETPAITPRIAVTSSAYRVVMPWDPGYLDVPGEGRAIDPADLPAHLAARRSLIEIRRRGADQPQ